VTWKISTNLGRDAHVWVWEIRRPDQIARVVIEISATACSSHPLDLPDDTRRALETDGRTELLKVLELDEPPSVIRCGATGCTYTSAPSPDERGSIAQ
jgi:hypothetical protein